jgi:L-glyceraldehyde 3-phosphate reductase
MQYRRSGRSGLKLPAISLGLWHNFGDTKPRETQQAVLRRAFDLGVTHFDLANNYGPPYGSAEANFGALYAQDFRPYRDELVISTKADYVDVFYHHRPDPETPLEETMSALDQAVRSGKALYAAISNYDPERTRQAAAILRDLGTPLLIHQPPYSMLRRGAVENGLLDVLEEVGAGCICFSPLAQGILTDRYLGGVPEGSRASVGHFLRPDALTDGVMDQVKRLNELAAGRGQTLAQLALAWVLRDARMTSAIIGASSVTQLETNVAALSAPALAQDELEQIDRILTGDPSR